MQNANAAKLQKNKEYEILQRNARMKNDVCEMVAKWKREHNMWQKWIKKRKKQVCWLQQAK